ncbi:MAG: hypothetical protein ACK5GA_07095 [Holosporaceae bacterium]
MLHFKLEFSTKTFLQEIGGLQIKFNSEWRNTLKRFTEGLKQVAPRITDDYLREIVDVYRAMHPGENLTLRSGDIYVRDGQGRYFENGDTFKNVNQSMRDGNRGWPKGSSIKSLSQWLDENGYKNSKRSQADENGYRDNQITDKYLHEIVRVYRERHSGKNPTQGSGDIYVKNKNGEYVKTIDTFNAVNMAMREGNRGWPEDSPIKSLSQWLDENGYRDNQITDKYLHEIVGVYRERHSGKNPTRHSGDIYVSDGRGKYVKTDDTFCAVSTAMNAGGRGWPKGSPIKSLSQWLEANGYKNSKRSPTQATEGHDAAQLRARGDR